MILAINLWSYTALFLLGMICGIFIWERFGVGTVYKGLFKIKQRGKGNVQNTELELKTAPETKRAGRKQASLQRKIDKKKARLLRKSNKLS